MQNTYFVKLLDGSLHCFYYSTEKEICIKTYEINKWGEPVTVVSDCAENYRIAVSERSDKALYLFYSDNNGNIYMATSHTLNMDWTSKIILKNESPIVNMIVLDGLITRYGLKIIYNTPSNEDKAQFMTSQSLTNHNEWGISTRLDQIIPFQESMFYSQQVADNLMLVFYATKNPDLTLGYREMTGEFFSDFKPIQSTSFQISDVSFLTTSSVIHILYVIKSIYGCQLVYKQKNSQTLTNPIILAEAKRIDNCLLYIVKGVLFASYMVNGQLFSCSSTNQGLKFNLPEKYKNKFCSQPTKAFYLSQKPQTEDDFFIREVYVDSTDCADIQILPNMYEDFYPIHLRQIVAPKKEDVISDDFNYDPFKGMKFTHHKYENPVEKNHSDKNFGDEKTINKDQLMKEAFSKMKFDFANPSETVNEKSIENATVSRLMKSVDKLEDTIKNKDDEIQKLQQLLEAKEIEIKKELKSEIQNEIKNELRNAQKKKDDRAKKRLERSEKWYD